MQKNENLSDRPVARPVRVVLPLIVVTLAGCLTTVQRPPPAAPENQPRAAVAAPGSQAPALDSMRRAIERVLMDLRSNRDGEVYADAVPGTDPDALAIAVMLVDGALITAGDADQSFPLMSVSKPFTFGLAIEQRGASFMLDRIGVSATGLPYNSVGAGALRKTTEQNPMVNAGAIATHSYLLGDSSADKRRNLLRFYSLLANRPLAVEEAWRASPRALTLTLAYQMQAADRLEGDPSEVADRYLESNVVAVRVDDLAAMGATLAAGGTQPVTRRRVLHYETARTMLSAMAIAGMYEGSGRWWVRVGVPAKSGVSGAVLAIVPGWGAIAAYSPRLDSVGNSVRAALFIEQLTALWGLHSVDRLLGPAPGRPSGAEPDAFDGTT